MQSGRIANATRNLGAPSGWDHEKQGRCGHLVVRDVLTTAGPAMQSVWFPTPGEIERIRAGAPVYLTVLGHWHPPVAMEVGPVPDVAD